jgi:hypothetical protein
MFMEQTRPFLEYGALLWANILGLLAIIFIIVIFFLVVSLQRKVTKALDLIEDLSMEAQEKTLETLDAVQDAAFQVAENTFSFGDIFNGIAGVAGFLNGLKPKPKAKKKALAELLSKFM